MKKHYVENQLQLIKYFLLSFLAFIFFINKSISQTNISGIINSYSSVTAINTPNCVPCAASCVHTVTVANGALFAPGDFGLIIQMKGATINTANTITSGAVTAINNSGNYEFFEIVSIAGNVLTTTFPFIKQYSVAGVVQVVRVPNYPNGANITGTLTAADWSEATGTGGVLALKATNVIFSANIDVVGKGFQGVEMNVDGTPDNCTVDPASVFVVPSTNNSSWFKGAGIVADDPATSKGRAPRANGGGSGISGDSGGGGGSNYGSGGEGGKRWCDINNLNAGGLGGRSLIQFVSDNKVFLGGGGGSGFRTTGNSATPSNGGGIVMIFANNITGNGFTINASGVNAFAVNPTGAPDGGGGGGAGGSVA